MSTEPTDPQLAQLADNQAAPYWSASPASIGTSQWCYTFQKPGYKTACNLEANAFVRCFYKGGKDE